jgi:hypothetical protein
VNALRLLIFLFCWRAGSLSAFGHFRQNLCFVSPSPASPQGQMGFGEKPDPQSARVTLSLVRANPVLAGRETAIEETVMDRTCHDNGLSRLLSETECHFSRTFKASSNRGDYLLFDSFSFDGF